MVSLQVNGNHICGGFLVSLDFVLTAAHCWKDVEWTAVVGAHDLRANDYERIPVQQHHIHRKYVKSDPSHDIMLLKLGKPAANNKNVALISIPKTNEEVQAGEMCSVAGWGGTKTSVSSNVLLEASVKVFASSSCKEQWRYENILCAGGLYRGFCKGDSGGPLVCHNTAVGIASFFKDPCDHPPKPNAYIKIAEFLPWIKSIIGNIKEVN
ncbi:hypothetical protein NFI96_016832 [Prochilodus magdalenae]|nr:hypothetical protein NFI96_016832 [Prochilodus magdalenae]